MARIGRYIRTGAGRHRCEPDDPIAFNGYVGDAKIMPELILPGKLVKESIEVWLGGSELRTLVAFT